MGADTSATQYDVRRIGLADLKEALQRGRRFSAIRPRRLYTEAMIYHHPVGSGYGERRSWVIPSCRWLLSARRRLRAWSARSRAIGLHRCETDGESRVFFFFVSNFMEDAFDAADSPSATPCGARLSLLGIFAIWIGVAQAIYIPISVTSPPRRPHFVRRSSPRPAAGRDHRRKLIGSCSR